MGEDVDAYVCMYTRTCVHVCIPECVQGQVQGRVCVHGLTCPEEDFSSSELVEMARHLEAVEHGC